MSEEYDPTPHVCQFCETPLRDHWWDPCTYTPPRDEPLPRRQPTPTDNSEETQ